MSDYEVGYGKPPPEHRFPKGKSGNPKGRPKTLSTIRDILKKIVAEEVDARLPGGEKSITVLELTLRSLVQRAAKGDNRATQQFLAIYTQAFGIGEEDPGERDLSAEDKAILQDALKFMGIARDGQ